MSEKGRFDGFIEKTNEIKVKLQKLITGENDGKNVEALSNMANFNNTCMLLTMIFIVIFIYKKEFLQFLNKNLNIKL
jgi:hypothetical protein